MADVVLHREIERFRERLLDLSLRNPLLSYRKSKRRTLQIVDQLPNVIYERLVEAGKSFELAPLPDPPEQSASDQEQVPAIFTGEQSELEIQVDNEDATIQRGQAARSEPRGNVNPVGEMSEGVVQYPLRLPEHVSELRGLSDRTADDRLQTNLTKERLDSLIRYMQREAGTAMQETGINYLFLALGFLSWRESTSSEKDRIAPLLLIPIRIEKVAKPNGESQFTIQWDEDDVQSNLSLQKKLSRDFDLSLPEFQIDSNPEAYFQEVRSTIRSLPAWSVLREAVVGFFSFHKLSMYADIDPANWNLEGGAADGSIVEQLICGAAATDSDLSDVGPSLYARDYDIDRNPTVSDLVLSMDADSSQQSALVDIREGRNLVIEGPPGTGKSQTITNAIADAIGAGKTVLFVAEKLAALQVVHNRLAALSLDDFCLELHSDAASPRQVFASLQKRLAASYESPQDLEVKRQRLDELRTRLNGYVSEMAEVVGPTRVALYDLLWRIIELRSGGAMFDRRLLEQMPEDHHAFQRCVAELKVFSRLLAESPELLSSPWWGFFPEGFAFSQMDEIQGHLITIREASGAIRATAEALATGWGIAPSDAIAVCDRLQPSAIRKCAEAVPPNAAALTQHLTDTEALKDCEALLAVITNKETSLHRLTSEFATDPLAVMSVATPLQRLLEQPGWNAGTSLDQVKESMTWATELHRLTREAIQFLDVIRTCGLPSRCIPIDLARANKVVQLIQHPVVDDARAVTQVMFDGTAKSAFRTAFRESERLRSARQDIASELDRHIAGTSCSTAAAAAALQTITAATTRFHNHQQKRMSIAEADALAQWCAIALTAIDGVLDIANKFGQAGLPSAATFEQFTKGSALVQLARHSLVKLDGCLSEAMFTPEGRRSFQQAFQMHQGLVSRRTRLEDAFHGPSIPSPEVVTRIAKTLRKHRRSWLRIINKEYREARSQLDEFTAIGEKRQLGDWIRSLEELETLANDEQQFVEDPAIAAQLGTGFKGIDTDWESLKRRFDWVHTIRQHGLDFEAALQLVNSRNEILPDISSIELRQAESAFKDCFLSDESKVTEIVTEPCARLPLADLRDRISNMSLAARDFVAAAEVISAPTSWTCEDMLRLFETLERATQLEQDYSEFHDNPVYRSELGIHFEGEQTQWRQLETAFNWVQTAVNNGADFSVVTQFFSQRSQILRDYRLSASVKCLADLEAHLESLPAVIAGFDYHAMDQHQVESHLRQLIAAIEDGLLASETVGCRRTELVESLRERLELADTFREADCLMQAPAKWQSIRTNGIYDLALQNPTQVRAIMDWVHDAHDVLQPIPDSHKRTIIYGAATDTMLSLCDRISESRENLSRIQQCRERFSTFGTVSPQWLVVDTASILSGKTESACSRLESAVGQLPAWSSFCRALAACDKIQLRSFCDAAIAGTINTERLSDAYQLTVFELVAEGVFQSSPTLRHTSGQTMHGLREEFQSYDRQVRDLGRLQIASRAAARWVPAGNGKGRVSELTELALIRHESQKQRRHCRIRDLMSRAGNAVQALKPCLMMSPLSVSRFLPEGSVEFDLVIMDEASQIKPEDAIGTMLRAKQVVVVGDPKQLPPTSFFDRLEEEVDEEELTQLDNTESVLEAAMKVYQPFRRLRWHYRSKHESLIRFSNSRFYDNDLVVFPSPTCDRDSYGIRHVLVDDATCTGGLNPREAEAVVEEIVRHAMTRPDESLGVGAFNKTQSELINELLEKRCESDRAAAIAVDRIRHGDEGLFIKNLENLQGDERDVIFVCYTYGKDPASGRLMQRFGPINSQNGWRRLNVLITRSRHRMVVFSSFHPGDVQGGPDKSRGVNAYKDFLTYAMTGTLDDGGTVTGRPPDSPFEVAVCRQIERMGLEAVPQVGVAGFFIDIGVRQREGDRSFIIGIECDGSTYHSARSARDRDRLREEIIRSRGWKIHRIWSTDWFLDQATEVKKLEAAIICALNGGTG